LNLLFKEFWKIAAILFLSAVETLEDLAAKDDFACDLER